MREFDMGSLLSCGLNWGPPERVVGAGVHSVISHVKDKKKKEKKEALLSFDCSKLDRDNLVRLVSKFAIF